MVALRRGNKSAHLTAIARLAADCRATRHTEQDMPHPDVLCHLRHASNLG